MDINAERKLIVQQRQFYEQKFTILTDSQRITDDDIDAVLELLSQIIINTRENKIKIALQLLLKLHEIFYEFIPRLKSKPWSNKFEALLVKYNLNH